MNFLFSKTRCRDILFLCFVSLLAAWVGYAAIGDLQGNLLPNSRNLLAMMRQSVFFAAGFGMGKVECAAGEFPALEQFLSGQISEIPRESFPAACSVEYAPDSFMRMHCYLFYHVGWFFRLFGISVHSFHLACLFLLVLSAAAAYAVFRLAVPPLFAAAGALLLAGSPAFLLMFPDMRDFGKTPFILFALFIMGALLKRPLSPRRILVFSFLLGAVIGVGYGFRQDLVVCLPPALVTVLFGTQAKQPWFPRLFGTVRLRTVPLRASAALAVSVAFALTALPVLRADRSASGATSAHTLIQGIMQQPEEHAGLHRVDYDWGVKTFDPFIIATINGYALRAGAAYPAAYMTQAYADTGRRMFLDVASVFPADVFKRGLLSVIHLGAILDDEHLHRSVNRDKEEPMTLTQLMRDLQHPFSRHLAKYGTLYCLAALCIMAAVSYRQALFAAFLLFYFGAYPGLLFEFRHYFPLVVIPMLCAFIFYRAIFHVACILVGRGGSPSSPSPWRCARRRARYQILFGNAIAREIPFRCRGCVFILLLVAGISCLLALFTLIQNSRVALLLQDYAHVEMTPLAYNVEQNGERITLRLDESLTTEPLELSHVAPAYMAMRFREANRTVTLQLLNNNDAFERLCEVALRGSGVYFFPVYDFGWAPPAFFTGVEMDVWDYELLDGLYLAELPESFRDSPALRLWPYIHIPDKPDVFLAHKTSALDALLQMARIEFATAFGLRRARALSQYKETLWKYRFMDFFVHRAFHHAHMRADSIAEAELWQTLANYAPSERARASQWLWEESQCAASTQEYTRAVQLCKMGITAAPYDLRHWEHLAELFAFLGNSKAARDAYCEILRRGPEFLLTAHKLTNAYAATAETTGAVEFFRDLANEHPDAATPSLYLGINLELLGKHEEAEKAYGQALAIHADNVRALYRLGALRLLAGDIEAGEAMALRAAESDTNLAGEIAARCADVATIYIERGEYHAAQRIYALAVDILPEELLYHTRLAEIHEKLNDPETARRIYLEVLYKAPESLYTAEKLTALAQQGKINNNDVIKEWTQLIEQYPTAVIPKIHLGFALEEAGDINGAIDAYTKALLLQPDATAAKTRLHVLRQSAIR